MKLRRYIGHLGVLIILTVLVYSSQSFAASRVSATTSFFSQTENDTSVLHMECRYDADSFYTSKVALIKTKDSRFDYGLSSGHGLVFDGLDFARDCRVVDHKGQRYALKALYIPTTFSPGRETDWALIRLPKINNKEIVRFKLPEYERSAERTFREQTNSISFAKARGIGQNSQNCQSYPGHYMSLREPSLLVHDCRVIPGQSGSPISVKTEDANLLIGLHLGTGIVVRSKITGKPGRLGYFRFIDKSMVQEIDLIITGYFN